MWSQYRIITISTIYLYVNTLICMIHVGVHILHTTTNNSVSVKANSTWNYPYGKVTQVKCECVHLVCHKN